MITLHHLENSRSQRMIWLLEELGLDYRLKIYKRRPDMLAPPELKAVHPLGHAPVLTTARRTLAESGAIAEYLLVTYGVGRLTPREGSAAWMDYIYWMHATEGSAMPPILLRLICETVPKKTPWPLRPLASAIMKGLERMMVTPNLKAQTALWEDTLTRHAWFAGPVFTAADIMMSFPVEAAARFGLLEHSPQTLQWLKTIQARPTYRRALLRGGPYTFVLDGDAAGEGEADQRQDEQFEDKRRQAIH
ncbi:glutathione S-transferase [Asticcacaulis sp. EMRT-3]|uniref:glutathione S-transferase n=1 Tax=Asticcacaulis sp. EMRT-3 TaxID=3040349 RepID=UPI0024AEBAE6|nr:glutathione S-transferase [Asticcacaulis sp. EMRT-3]MDI7774350.1 glutathione S-transferase [Asticcacaulis sp. EMRT-3]